MTIVKTFICNECGVDCNDSRHLRLHLTKEHGMDYEQYVLKHYFNGIRPKCQCGCGEEMLFKAHYPNFYKEFRQNHRPYGPLSEDAKRKISETCKKVFLERYGVENPMFLKKFVDKISDTKLERYGDPNYNNLEKTLATNMDKYGEKYFVCTDLGKQKIVDTNMKKYGAKSFTATELGKAKCRETKKERYGDENYQNMEKVAETKLKKYGYRSEFENNKWRRTYNHQYSNIEKLVAEKLNATHKFYYSGKEYDMIIGNVIIEVDGDYYHPKQLIDLNFIQLGSSFNDYNKMKAVQFGGEYELYRVSHSMLKKNRDVEWDLDFVIKNSYVPDYTILDDQIILSKRYMSDFISKRGVAKFESRLRTMIKFLRTFFPSGIPSVPHDVFNDDAVLFKCIKQSIGYDGIDDNFTINGLRNVFC